MICRNSGSGERGTQFGFEKKKMVMSKIESGIKRADACVTPVSCSDLSVFGLDHHLVPKFITDS